MSSQSSAPSGLRHAAGGELAVWRNAIFVVFALTGVGFATWVTRIPAARDGLELNTAQVAVLVFGLAGGSIIGLFGAPTILRRVGPRRGMLGGLIGFALGLFVAGLGVSVFESEAVTVAGLAFLGFSYGSTDVFMNVEAAEVEALLGRTVMPLMHACFSIGTIIGSALGATASAVGLGVGAHFAVIATVMIVTSCLITRLIPLLDAPPVTDGPGPPWRERLTENLAVLRDVRLLLIGVVMMGMAFTEGSANDWITLAAVDGYGFSNTQGALVFGVFVVAMTIGRIGGGPVLDRFGRVRTLVAVAVIGIAGLLLFIWSPDSWAAYLGAALWGVGGSLGFPVGMSAAADHPTHAAQRVSTVAMFGYLAFLVGPPALGLLGQRYGILNAFYLVLALLVLSLIASPAARRTPVRE